MHIFIVSLFLIILLFIYILIKIKGLVQALPIHLFLFFYFLTSFLGGVYFLYGGKEDLSTNDHLGLEFNILENINLFIYIILLFLPFIIVPLFYLIFDKQIGKKTLFKKKIVNFNIRDVLICYIFLVFIFIIYNVSTGSFYKFLDVLTTPSYAKLLNYREEVFSGLPVYIMSIINVILPSLSLSTLYVFSENKNFKNFILSMALSIFSICMSITTFQKAPLIIFLLMVAIFSVYLKLISKKVFISVGILSFILIYVFQSFLLFDWSLLDTVNLLIYRTAISIPYYISIYPSIIGYQGPDMLFDGKTASDNIIVFQHMYPLVESNFGAIAAPDFIRSYSKGGVFYSLISLIYTSLVLALLGLFFKKVDSLIKFLFLCIFSYAIFYLTQTNWKDVLLSSYGVSWGILFLSIYFFIKKILIKQHDWECKN